MSIGKGFLDEAHPFSYFILTALGYNYCQRNQAGEYRIKNNRIILSAMSIVFVGYTLVSDVTMWRESTDYSKSIGMSVQHMGKIQMLYVLWEMRHHRNNMATFLNGIGPNFYFERNLICRLRELVAGLFNVIFYTTMILSMNSSGCYMAKYKCVSLNIGWIVVYYLLPRLMDNLQVILIGPLINSYRSLYKTVKKIQSQAEKSLEMSNLHHDNMPECIKWKKCMQNYYSNDIKESRLRLKKLESLTSTFNKVRNEECSDVVSEIMQVEA